MKAPFILGYEDWGGVMRDTGMFRHSPGRLEAIISSSEA